MGHGLTSIHVVSHIRIDNLTAKRKISATPIKLSSVGKDITYLVGVDGKKGASGNYRIMVQCRTYR